MTHRIGYRRFALRGAAIGAFGLSCAVVVAVGLGPAFSHGPHGIGRVVLAPGESEQVVAGATYTCADVMSTVKRSSGSGPVTVSCAPPAGAHRRGQKKQRSHKRPQKHHRRTHKHS
jgi:hypothetical protein